MPHSEAVLLQQLFNYANQTSKSMNSGVSVSVTDDTLGYLNAVKVAFQNNKEKYDRFLKVLRDFSAKRIYISRVKAKFKTLFKGHNYLILVFNSFVPEKHRFKLSLEDSQTIEDSHASGFMKDLKLAIQYKRKNNFHDFLKVLKDYQDQTIDISGFSARMKVLLKYHPDLIWEFNTFLPSQYRIKIAGKKLQDNGHLGQLLPWDVLDIICERLDFNDLFSFSGVCKNWRTFYKSNFMSSQEPLLLRHNGIGSYSFISIPNQKIYDLNTMSCFKNCVYVRASSGYFIFADKNNSFRLFNPFTREKLVINATFTVNAHSIGQNEALLAFEKCSEEFVLVVLCKESRRLYVYQSRYDDWFSYSTLKPDEVVVDFVVLNNIIYVVTDNANIGVLNLNSGKIIFLNLKNTPTISKYPYKDLSFESSFRLVNCDGQLLVLDLRYWHTTTMEVYKIDLSTMSYIKMKTLGDIALFYVSCRKCLALSNPRSFGYHSNYVYEVNSSRCVMYDWNDDDYFSTKVNPHQGSGDFNFFDWCFGYEATAKEYYFFDWCIGHLKYQVDYSLVE